MEDVGSEDEQEEEEEAPFQESTWHRLVTWVVIVVCDLFFCVVVAAKGYSQCLQLDVCY